MRRLSCLDGDIKPSHRNNGVVECDVDGRKEGEWDVRAGGVGWQQGKT